MKIEANSIDELIKKSGNQQETLVFVDEFIQKVAPKLTRKLFKGPSITMIGYGEMPWKGKTKSGVWPLISVAPQKGTTNLYIAADKAEQPLPLYYGKKLGKVSIGKNCIRVKKIETLNLSEFENLIQDAMAWMELNINKYGRDCAKPID